MGLDGPEDKNIGKLTVGEPQANLFADSQDFKTERLSPTADTPTTLQFGEALAVRLTATGALSYDVNGPAMTSFYGERFTAAQPVSEAWGTIGRSNVNEPYFRRLDGSAPRSLSEVHGQSVERLRDMLASASIRRTDA